MRFSTYISSKEARKRDERELARRQVAAFDAEIESHLQAMKLVKDMLPELKKHAKKQAVPVEFNYRLSFLQRARLEGGWILGTYFYDNSQSSEHSQTVMVAVTESGRIVSGRIIQRNGLEILHVRRQQRHQKPINVLYWQQQQNAFDDIFNKTETAIHEVMSNPKGIGQQLATYFQRKSRAKK